MKNKILSTVKKYNMLSDGDKVLVGVSGGADSVVLLDFLLSVKDLYNLDISVAHIEHGIRGEDSLKDAEFVRALCEKNNVPFHLLSIDAINEAKNAKQSVEEYSRNRRYEFFNSIECDKIATAHNLTDNIETVLFRLSRGTGIKGVCGIPPVRQKIIRPLIEISSKEIRDYCKDNSISFRIDSTNADNSYSRNFVRNVILKDFSALNNDFEKNISRFISNVNEDFSFIQSSALSAFDECYCNGMLDISVLKLFDIAIVKRVLIKYFDCPIDELHINEILKLLEKPSKVQIKGDYFAVSDGRFLRKAHFNNSENEIKYTSQILNIFEFNKDIVDFYCDYDKIKGSVIVRKRNEGDRISPAFRGCTKTLKKLFNEYKIPIEKRNSIPVVCDDLGVIGVVGICVDERVKCDKSTKRLMTIKLPLED